ncbi:MAG: ROK family protein [Pseudonocardiaceae bacterium]
MLSELRRSPGLTRVELARRLSLASASSTEVTARLRAVGWLVERRAPSGGRGRPTSVLTPDPRGPVVVAIDLRHEDWRCALAGLDGQCTIVGGGRHLRRDPETVVEALCAAVGELVVRHAGRVVAVGVAVAGTVMEERLVQAASLGWEAVDLQRITAPHGVPIMLGNDATLAGVAEARTGAAGDARSALYLTVEVGVGGALIIEGRPYTGGHGAAGEYGHLPFGDPDRCCPCGARGCWGLEVDGRALARHLGEPEPADPRSHAAAVLDWAVAEGDAAARRAIVLVARSLGRGVAGLVNAHDPDVVVLGGLGVALRSAAGDAFRAAYRDGLMAFHRRRPPPVVDPAHGDDAALRGAAALALDYAISPDALAALADRQGQEP